MRLAEPSRSFVRPGRALALLIIGLCMTWGCSRESDAPVSHARAPDRETEPRSECPAWKGPEGTGTPIILIVVDTLRADHLSVYGYARPTSPTLERWARRGVVFERAYASSPWTLPSFASIYTGQSPSVHSAGYLLPEGGDDRHEIAGGMTIHGETKLFAPLAPDSVTLAEILCAAGYATGAVVNNPFLHPRFGIDRGFAHYDYEGGNDADVRRSDEMVDRALVWIDEQQGRPFFLLLHLFDPHMNYDAPEPHRGRFSEAVGSMGTLPVQDTPALRSGARGIEAVDRKFIAAAYDEEIAFVDAQVGRLMNQLERRGLTGSALVVLTADHGEELFDHESFGHGHTLYEEQLRVPLMLMGRGVEPGRHDVPVSIIDVAPTLLEAAGMDRPQGMEGFSLWGAASGTSPPPERLIYAERRGSLPERKVVIRWPYKLIVEAGDREPRLYDLSADPAERMNLSGQRPQVMAVLGGELERRFQLDAGRAPAASADLDAETLEKLRALGYMD
jgi:choline-sulfatase